MSPTFGYVNAYLDEQFVAEAKATAIAEGEVDFVSTNDVFTSWSFQVHKADLGNMAYNIRPLLRGVEDTDALAGNYLGSLAFSPSEFPPRRASGKRSSCPSSSAPTQ